VWVAIFSTFAFAFFTLLQRSEYKRASFLVLCLLCFYLAAATRHNGVSILPVCAIPLVPFFERQVGFRRAFALSASGAVILLMIVATKVFIFLPNVRTISMLPMGLLNQYLGTIANSPSQIKDKLLQTEGPIFDAKLGSGTLAKSVSTYEPDYSGGLLWGSDPIIGFENLAENGGFLIERLPRVVMESPRGFLLHKTRSSWGLFDDSSSPSQYPFGWGIFEGPARWGELHIRNLGVSSQPVLVTLNKSIPPFLYSQADNLLYKHWFMFLLGFLAFLFALKLGDVVVMLTFSYAVLYAIPYLFVDLFWEWRYLMPSYIASFLSITMIALRLPAVCKAVFEALGSRARGHTRPLARR
jgi:hypothetical protein